MSTEQATNPTEQIAQLLMGETSEQHDEDVSEATTEDEVQHQASDEDADDDGIEVEAQADDDDDAGDEVDVDAVAQALGLDPKKVAFSDEGELLIEAKVDGEVTKLKVADLVKNYQTEAAVTQRFQKLSEEKKAFDQQKVEASQRIAQQVDVAEGLLRALVQEMTADIQKTDWQTLRQVDPAEFVARQHDFE